MRASNGEKEFQMVLESQSETSPEKNLVAAVFLRALHDLKSKGHRINASCWFLSNSNKPMSFRWCCLVMGLDADSILSKLAISFSQLPLELH